LFKEQGKTIILITHKLQEILDITDEVTVMRAGTVVGSVQTANTNKEQLAELMVGRPIETHLPRAPYAPGETVLDVKGLNLINAQQVSLLKDLNFNIRAGEIVAIAGVSGNGQSELLEVLSGMRLPSSGAVTMQGKRCHLLGAKMRMVCLRRSANSASHTYRKTVCAMRS
jgi:simple sugar transport system ATP-binding protein